MPPAPGRTLLHVVVSAFVIGALNPAWGSEAPAASTAQAQASPEVVYDRGYAGEERKLQPAANCVKVPCLIGANGIIKFPHGIPADFDLRFG